MTFTRWLYTKRNERGSVGILARWVRDDCDWPEDSIALGRYYEFVLRRKRKDLIPHVTRAWREYVRFVQTYSLAWAQAQVARP